MKIQDKVVVISGGASGLGAATARYFVEEKGAKVAVYDLDKSAGHALIAELGRDVSLFAEVDVTCDESVRRGVASTVEQFGQIDVCINCAGIPSPCKVLDRDGKAVPLDRFSNVVKVNLVGTFNLMSIWEENGVVVNISSGAAYEGQIGQCAYGASKSGVLGLNMPAARELGRHGIRVNAIAPGLFHTPMVDSLGQDVIDGLVANIEAPKRMGTMQEFAHTCAFLVENSYINAETVRLDAATRMRAR